MPNKLIEQITKSPVGFCLLSDIARTRLEEGGQQYEDEPADVGEALDYLSVAEFSDIVDRILSALDLTSPWRNPNTVPLARSRFRLKLFGRSLWKPQRKPESITALPRSMASVTNRYLLAERLVERFYDRLSADLEPQSQEIWELEPPKLARDYHTHSADSVYGEGQFTWFSVRSMTKLDTLENLEWILSDKGEPSEHSCYIPVTSKELKAYEVHSFEAWQQLIKDTSNKEHTKPLAPHWPTIYNNYDVIHLSWMGIIVAHDHLRLADKHDVVPLRYWGHEQTHWARSSIEEFAKVESYLERRHRYSDDATN